MIKKIILIITMCNLFSFLTNSPLFSSTIEISNKYIKIIGYINTGRYVIKTTGGDPMLMTDQNALLLYEDNPPYSFSTVRIDGKEYIYGSSIGKFTQPMTIKEKSLICTWEINNISIIQKMAFVKGLTTGREDTVEISFKIWNKDAGKHEIGLRVVLDTYLGKEDGAPFRIPGGKPIISETEFTGKDIPKYWYSFDDLINPAVRAQGALITRKVKPPDKITFASFARFADHDWDFQTEEGRSFKRGFLQPIDSAVGLYWQPKEIDPDSSFFIKTFYGIYGTSVKRGKGFNLSLSSPTEVYDDPFLINADLQNASQLDAIDVRAKLALPKGLELFLTNQIDTKNAGEKNINKTLTVRIGKLDAKEMSRASWRVKPNGEYSGKAAFRVSITGFFADKKAETSAMRILDIIATIAEQKKIEKIKEKIVEQIIEQIKKEDETLSIKSTDKGVIIEFGDISFKFGSAELTTSAKNELQKIGKVIQNQKKIHLNIYGHTDNIGKDQYNYKLSTARAKSVFRFLIFNKFIDEFQAIYKGFGEKKPIAGNDTEKGRKKNRRVEIIIIPETE